MKISDLLEEVKLGPEEYKNKQNIEAIVESFNEEIDDYKISDIVKESNDKLLDEKNLLNESVLRNLFTCQNKLAVLEEKAENITPVYAKMKFNSIKKNLVAIEEALQHKKILKTLNEDLLVYSLALVKTKMDWLAEEADIEEYNFEIAIADNINEEAEVIKKIVK